MDVFFLEHYGFPYIWYSYLHCSVYASFRYLHMFCLANISIFERSIESLYHTWIFIKIPWFPVPLDLYIYSYPLCWLLNLLYKWCAHSIARYLCLFLQPCLIFKCVIQLSFSFPNIWFSICIQPLSSNLEFHFQRKHRFVFCLLSFDGWGQSFTV